MSAAPSPEVTYSSTTGRWVLFATVVGSGMAMIDATVVNVALPSIGADFQVEFAALQWTITAYTLTLASLILLGGSLGDRFGRRRVFVIGVVWFAGASLLCGLAPDAVSLVVTRALQGVGAALLTPGSLAIIQASFRSEDRARAIGAWSGLGGVATAIGPLLGGWLILVASWRWVFLINLPLAVVVVVSAIRHLPESRDQTASGRVDIPGAALVTVGLGASTFAIIQVPSSGLVSGTVLVSGLIGLFSLVGFVVVELRSAAPMMPLTMFSSMQFSAANVVTFMVYGAFGGAFFLLAIQLQVVSGFTPFQAGLSMLPITVVMLLFSARSGQLAERIGPRVQMTTGPLVCAVGVLMMREIGPRAEYLTTVLPAVTIFGLGLAVLVAPLTATVLAAAPTGHAGIASGVNNAVARAASLVAIAALPVVAGISGTDYESAVGFGQGFRTAMLVAAVILLVGGVLAAATIRNRLEQPDMDRQVDQPWRRTGCPIAAPPLAVADQPIPGEGVDHGFTRR